MLRLPERVEALADYDEADFSDADVRIRGHRNEAALPPPPHVVAAVRALAPEQFSRYPVDAMRRFAGELAQSLGVSPERLVLGSGADDVLVAVARTTHERGGPARGVGPAFGMYARAALGAGASVRELRYRKRWNLDAGELLGLVDERTRLIFLGHPNNPTGEALGSQTLERIARGAPNAVVAVDEIYLCLREASLLRAAQALENVVVIGSLSKNAALAGMRVGYAAASGRLARAMRRIMPPYPLGAASLAAAHAYLREREETARFERALAAQVERSLAILTAAVAPYAREIWRGPANFALAELEADARAFARALRREGIAVRTFSDPEMANMVRFCALGAADTQALAERIPAAVLSARGEALRA